MQVQATPPPAPPSRSRRAKEKMRAKREQRLTRAVRIELVKPLGPDSWDTIGPLLRVYRSIMHRLTNAAVLDAVEMANRQRRGETVKPAIEVAPPYDDGIPNSQTAGYRAITAELGAIRDWYTRELDRFQQGGAKRRSTKRKKKAQSVVETLNNPETTEQRARELTRLALLANLALPSAIQASVSQYAWASASKWLKDRATRVPSAKLNAPISVLRGSIDNPGAVLMVDDQKRITLKVKLRTAGHVTFAVRAGNGSNWEKLNAIVKRKDGAEQGDVKIVYDAGQRGNGGKRKGKWFAIVAFSVPKPTPPAHLDPLKVLVLHRGHRNLLVAMGTDGHHRILARGGKLTAAKRKFKQRREQVKRISQAERGGGATGHGRKRFYALPDELERKEADFVKTHCQQLAAQVRRMVLECGYGTVKIEDYGGIGPDDVRAIRRFVDHPPYHQLRDAIKNALQAIGVELGTYPHEYISQTCPACGNQHAGQHNLRTGVFHCQRCGLDRLADWVAPLHALRRANGGAAGTWEKIVKIEDELGGSLKTERPPEQD